MKLKNVAKSLIIIIVFAIVGLHTAWAQVTIVRGVVMDSLTQKPLENASVSFIGTRGSITDKQGRYYIESSRKVSRIVVSYVGYKKRELDIERDKDQVINIYLEVDSSSQLQDVVITNRRTTRYRNKNNPAVDLIRKVIDHKAENRGLNYEYTEYEQYDKLLFSLANPTTKVTDNKRLKKYKFLFDNRDTTTLEGRSLLPVFIEETLVQKYFRKKENQASSKVLATKRVNFGPMVDNKGISNYFNYIYQDVDIYESNIFLLTTQFLSPIADLAPTFYMYTIRDTIKNEFGERLVELYFTPRNTNDVLFRGTMFITIDGHYAVQKVDMSISKNINVNFVKSLNLQQNFARNSDGRWHVAKSHMQAEFGLSNNKSAGGVFGERLVSYKNYLVNQPRPDSFYAKKTTDADDVVVQTVGADSVLAINRHDTLSRAQGLVYANMDSLQKMPSFKRLMDIGTLLFAGYKTYRGVEIGPVSTFYSFNPVEGFRLRFGGRTTPDFSTRWYFQTYGAYGFKDKKWKYFLSGAYSFNNKSIYQFPNNFVRASMQRDTKIPGHELAFVSEDNFLLSFKRGENTKYLYNDTYQFEYVREFVNNFSMNLGFKHLAQTPAGSLSFVKYANTSPVAVQKLTTAEFFAEFRYAPFQKFYQSRTYRTPMFNQYPIMTFRFTQGVKGLLNSEYKYSSFYLNIFKKFFLSQLGYTHAVLEGGYLLGQVPYPLLTAHRANQTYAYQLQSYNLMNFLEFASDHYVGLNLDHNFSGLLLNRIPLLRKFKLREMASFKILMGGIRDENDPAKNEELYARPTDSRGNLNLYSMNSVPYMEASVGISNIFKILRVDLVKRLTYLSHPDITPLGIRARIKFDF